MASDGDRLVEFVRAAKARSVPDDSLAAMLRNAGWPERRIAAALTAYYEGEVGLAVPERGGRAEYAREAFFYLVAFVTLAIWAVAFGHLLYALIDRAFADPLNARYAGSFRDEVSADLAGMIVAFPIYLFVQRAIGRSLAARPENADSGVRMWLIYLALVITTCIALGDVVWFLATFLRAALTAAFVLKSLVVLGIAGGVLWYYLGAVRTRGASPERDRAFGAGAALAIAAGLVFGFFAYGTPQHARAVGADQTRVERLQAIAQQLYDRSSSTENPNPQPLPEHLDEIASGTTREDPVTKAQMEYHLLGATTYQLCATFDAVSENDTQGLDETQWQHPAGRKCFVRDVNVKP
jgi:uncharacterized protein DUF5671